MTFETLSSEAVYHGRVFDVLRERVQYPDGRIADVDLVRHAGAVAILPMDADGNLVLIRQYRHAIGAMFLEIPAGSLEAGEEPEDCARRELREEIGMAPGWLRQLGAFYPAAGYTDELLRIFLAGELMADALEGDEDELIEIERFSPERVLEMAATGEIQDAKTLIALAWAADELRKPD